MGLYRSKQDGTFNVRTKIQNRSVSIIRKKNLRLQRNIDKDKSGISREIKRNADARSGICKAVLADKKAKYKTSN